MVKTKILWLCHFSNSEIRSKLPLTNKLKYHDYAPWIPSLANGIKKNKSIKLHIIAPHRGLTKIAHSFCFDNVYYHFFKTDLPSFRFGWSKSFKFNRLTNYFFNKLLVKLLVRSIKPDLINLHGAENPYYSSTILGLKKYPVLITIQGIYSNPKRFEGDFIKFDKQRASVERKIHSKFKFFGIFPSFFKDLINLDNPSPIYLFQHYIPNLKIEKPIGSNKKEFDFIFFARVNHVKGIEEIIDALKIVKLHKPDVTLKVIGRAKADYLSFLKTKIEALGLSKNIEIIGMLPKLEDVHVLASKAVATVIASKFENLPGTIMESILLDIPVITTDAGAIPILNSKGETVFMSKVGDVQSFADNMLLCLNDPQLAQNMTKKAKDFILKEFSEEVIIKRWINQYNAVLDYYRLGTDIPAEFLFKN